MIGQDLKAQLQRSREDIEISRRISNELGLIVPELNDLTLRQIQLESYVSGQGQLGFLPWLIAGGLAVGAAIGVWIRKQQEEARAVREYLECLKDMQERYGLSPDKAAEYCGGPKRRGISLSSILLLGGAALGMYMLLGWRR